MDFDEAKQTWDMTIDEKLAMAVEVNRPPLIHLTPQNSAPFVHDGTM